MPNELLPTNIQFGTVVGRFGSAPLIAGDADGLPDFSPAAGLTVTFTPSTAAVIDATASPAPVTIEMVPIVCGLDSQGYLVGGDGQRGVKLIATDDTDINPSGWTYSVTFLRNGSKVAAFRDFSMSLPQGVTKDIALTIPVPSSSGVSLSQAQAAEAAAVSAASQATAAASVASTAASSASTAASSAATFAANTGNAVSALDLSGATALGRTVLRSADPAGARDAIGAASATGSSKEVVAGDNIVLTDSTNLIISAVVGSQGQFSSIHRDVVRDATVSTGTGILRLSYRRATRSATFSSIKSRSGTTAATATPTLCKMGVFSVAANGDLTRLARTASDTAMFATASTVYTAALDVPVSVVAGQLYAFAVLVVTTGTPPSLSGVVMFNAAEAGASERMNGSVSGQTDIITSIPAASVTDSTSNPYLALL